MEEVEEVEEEEGEEEEGRAIPPHPPPPPPLPPPSLPHPSSTCLCLGQARGCLAQRGASARTGFGAGAAIRDGHSK
eukprot:2862485-Pyramimonas_sp.AAC.1